MNMKDLLKMHSIKNTAKPIEKPNKNLGVSTDETHHSLPLLIFAELTMPQAEIETEPMNAKKYEEMQIKGSGNTLDLDEVYSTNFDIGSPIVFD